MLTISAPPVGGAVEKLLGELVPDAGLQRVVGLPDIEKPAEGAAHLVPLVILDVRELRRRQRSGSPARIAVLPHCRQVAWIERGQVSQIRDRRVLVLLLHGEITHVHATDARPMKVAHSAVAMRLLLSVRDATVGAKSEPVPAFSTLLGR